MRPMKSTLLAFTAVLLAALPASADPHGVFVLYEGNAAANSRPVARTGATFSVRGRSWRGRVIWICPTAIALLCCAVRTLGHVGKMSSRLRPPSIRGSRWKADYPFLKSWLKVMPWRGRQYILKISHYNNQDPAGRNADLEHLGKVVEPVADKYHNEMFLEVHRASGMQTPDEVVAIYYDTPEAGDRFREKNQAILEKIGAFNKKHLKSFTYLVAQPD